MNISPLKYPGLKRFLKHIILMTRLMGRNVVVDSMQVSPNAVLESGVRVGYQTRIGTQVRISKNSQIGGGGM